VCVGAGGTETNSVRWQVKTHISKFVTKGFWADFQSSL
jgi:hypothetical protein